MYKLFIIYLALDRNGKLKSWKCRQLQDFWGDKAGDEEHQPELFEV